MTAEPAPTAVTVAVVTYRRPDDLAELLPLLIRQSVRAPSGYDVCVLVVDNDPEGSAAAVVGSHEHPALRCVLEPTPGIAAARNRALAEASRADLLVFIDDDERPTPHWLEHLLVTMTRTSAVAVTGPVRTIFDRDTVDPWLLEGGFLERRHRAGTVTGTVLTNAATNNLLLDLAALRRLDLGFDVAFGLSGGEDTLFTRSLARRGGHIIWCREAEVTERIDPSRLTRQWMLTRAFSYGSTDARVDVALAAGSPITQAASRVRSAADGLARIVVGSLLTLSGVACRSLARQAYGQQMAYRGAGLVLGSMGVTHERYRRPIPVAAGRS